MQQKMSGDMSLAGQSVLSRKKGDGSREEIIRWDKFHQQKIPPGEMAEHIAAALNEAGVVKLRPELAQKPKNKDLMYVYPVGDHHLGMLSWPEETGSDYNVEIGTEILEGAFSHLSKNTERGSSALVVLLGDFFHIDSYEAVTPKNRNLLDVDSRFPKIARAAIALTTGIIDLCRSIHSSVHVIIEQGNHDPSSAIMLREAMVNYYGRMKSVTVDNTPGVYHYYQFGNNLLGTHHGDKIKNLRDLPLIMAKDCPQQWGVTSHRMFLTGHLHKDVKLDLPGCSVESFRIMPPADAWAHESGYRPERRMAMLRLHRQFGETGRFFVTPEMLGG